MNTFSSAKDILKKMLKDISQSVYDNPDLSQLRVYNTKTRDLGDYQTNICFILAKQFKASPKEVAEFLIHNHGHNFSGYATAMISGNGFITFSINENILLGFIKTLISSRCLESKNKVHIVSPDMPKQKNVIVDYSSPNIAKPMHVGHLRSTVIGDALSNMLQFCGANVKRVNHIGDWGTQFGIMLAYIKEKNISLQNIKSNDQVLDIYVEANKLKKNAKFLKNAKSEVVKLQNGDASCTIIWKHLCNISIREFNKIYNEMHIDLKVMGESFYNRMLKSDVKEALESGVANYSDGAVCIFDDEFKDAEDHRIPFMIQKNDGGFGYAATDLSAILYRLRKMHASWIIYVTDDGQSLHFRQLFSAAKKICKEAKDAKLDHVAFGTVCTQEGKRIRTREGDITTLESLIEQAKTFSLHMCKNQPSLQNIDKEEVISIANSLAIGALKFSDLMCNRKSSYTFNFERMFKINGKSSVFINYTFVRIQRIMQQSILSVNSKTLSSFDELSSFETEIIRHMFKFTDCIIESVSTLSPHIVATYAYDLSILVNQMLENCRILKSNKEAQRLFILEASRMMLIKSMEILNIPLVIKM